MKSKISLLRGLETNCKDFTDRQESQLKQKLLPNVNVYSTFFAVPDRENVVYCQTPEKMTENNSCLCMLNFSMTQIALADNNRKLSHMDQMFTTTVSRKLTTDTK